MPEIPGDWVAMARLVGLLFVGYFIVIWFTSVVWVYRDIAARTNDPITQLIAVLVAVVFPIVGLPVYFVLRPAETLQEAYDRQLEQEAILSELHSISACPDCRRPISEDFMVCAYCGTQLKQPCVSCKQLMQFAWRHCPYCAAVQPRRQPAPRRGAEQREGRDRDAREGARDGEGAPRRQRAPERAPAAATSSSTANDPFAPATEPEARRRPTTETSEENAAPAVAATRPRRATPDENASAPQP